MSIAPVDGLGGSTDEALPSGVRGRGTRAEPGEAPRGRRATSGHPPAQRTSRYYPYPRYGGAGPVADGLLGVLYNDVAPHPCIYRGAAGKELSLLKRKRFLVVYLITNKCLLGSH